jgi:hypothetical protein
MIWERRGGRAIHVGKKKRRNLLVFPIVRTPDQRENKSRRRNTRGQRISESVDWKRPGSEARNEEKSNAPSITRRYRTRKLDWKSESDMNLFGETGLFD